jgi:hypothetical protein
MSILKYAYLLDQDNYIVENKVFIDLMWYISKNKDNGEGKSKGINTKSYVIRNSGIMFQQIFYWHYNAIKHNKPTKYQYNNKGASVNVVKMDFEDWWNSIRLTDTEVTTANKFLLETGLVEIHKMRIKVKDKDIFKPSNCYALKIDILEKYLEAIIEISQEMYKEKVDVVREKNIESSLKHREKLSTNLSTDEAVTLETQVTLNLESLEGVKNNLSTLSTELTYEESSVTLETGVTKVTLETEVTKATLETEVTKATLETEVTNKSNTSFTDSSFADTSSTDSIQDSSFSLQSYWKKSLNIIKTQLTDVSYNTWIEDGISDVYLEGNSFILKTKTETHKDILETRYKDLITNAFKVISGREYSLKFIKG